MNEGMNEITVEGGNVLEVLGGEDPDDAVGGGADEEVVVEGEGVGVGGLEVHPAVELPGGLVEEAELGVGGDGEDGGFLVDADVHEGLVLEGVVEEHGLGLDDEDVVFVALLLGHLAVGSEVPQLQVARPGRRHERALLVEGHAVHVLGQLVDCFLLARFEIPHEEPLVRRRPQRDQVVVVRRGTLEQLGYGVLHVVRAMGTLWPRMERIRLEVARSQMWMAGSLHAPSPAKSMVPSSENLTANTCAFALKYFTCRFDAGEYTTTVLPAVQASSCVFALMSIWCALCTVIPRICSSWKFCVDSVPVWNCLPCEWCLFIINSLQHAPREVHPPQLRHHLRRHPQAPPPPRRQHQPLPQVLPHLPPPRRHPNQRVPHIQTPNHLLEILPQRHQHPLQVLIPLHDLRYIPVLRGLPIFVGIHNRAAGAVPVRGVLQDADKEDRAERLHFYDFRDAGDPGAERAGGISDVLLSDDGAVLADKPAVLFGADLLPRVRERERGEEEGADVVAAELPERVQGAGEGGLVQDDDADHAVHLGVPGRSGSPEKDADAHDPDRAGDRLPVQQHQVVPQRAVRQRVLRVAQGVRALLRILPAHPPPRAAQLTIILYMESKVFQINRKPIKASPSYALANLTASDNTLAYLVKNTVHLIDLTAQNFTDPKTTALPITEPLTAITYLQFDCDYYLVLTYISGFLIYTKNCQAIKHQFSKVFQDGNSSQQNCYYKAATVISTTEQQFIVIGTNFGELYFVGKDFKPFVGLQFSKPIRVTALEAHFETQKLAVGDEGGVVHLFQTKSASSIEQIKQIDLRTMGNPITSMQVVKRNGTNSVMCCGDGLGRVSVIDLNEYCMTLQINAHVKPVSVMNVINKKDWLITASEDTYVNVWCLKDKPELIVSYHLTDSLIFGVAQLDDNIFISSFESHELVHLKLLG